MASHTKKPFIDHLNELRRRLTVCVVLIAAGSGAGYAVNEILLAIIQKPLGEKLFFTSPTGGFSFVFMLCVSFGILLALPFIIYQIIAFLRPVLPNTSSAKMLLYPVCSVMLAGLGVAFAYFISLPAALHFLTNIGLGNIEAMITTDTYFNFAFAYIVGFAILFQLPLLLAIINRITPLKPGKLMKAQRYVLVGSFIVAAILTPTPDPFNQLLMAGPIIILYQLSIILIWLINLKQRKPKKSSGAAAETFRMPQVPSAAQQPQVKPVSAPRLVVDVVPSRQATQPLRIRQAPIVAPRPLPSAFSESRQNLVPPRRLIDVMAN